MSSFHEELLTDLIKDWSLEQINIYLVELRVKREDMDKWIRHVEAFRRKKMPKVSKDNGPRDGR